MPTIPTGKMERELRRLYMQWVQQLPNHEQDLHNYVAKFQDKSMDLIEKMGGNVARLGALAGFPAPRRLDLSPHIGTIYSDMELAAIQAQIGLGLNPRDTARALTRAGVDKSYRRLERLARTETVSAYWKNAWDSSEGLGLVMVWGAERGPRTCQWCLERDGLVMDSPDLRDHPNGRCTPLPTHPSQVDYRGSVRADGQIYQDPAWTKATNQATQEPTMLPQEPSEPEWKPFMDAASADLWAKGSVIQGELMHGTSPAGAMGIRESGFSLSREEFGRMHGNGVYLTENARTAEMYSQGEVLKLRVNVQNPIDLDEVFIHSDYFGASDWVEEHLSHLTPHQQEIATIDKFLERNGFDALIKRGPDGSIDELIIPDPKRVTVVG